MPFVKSSKFFLQVHPLEHMKASYVKTNIGIMDVTPQALTLVEFA